MRNLIRTCNAITGEALAEEDDAEIILDHAEQKIFEIAEARTKQSFSRIDPVADRIVARVKEYAAGEGTGITGLSTGFRELTNSLPGCSGPILSSSPDGRRWARLRFV